MYCKCGDKCKKPTICAEKVCATTVDADFINSFVADFDEINAKTVTAETVTANQFVVTTDGSTTPTVGLITTPSPPVTLNLPVFGSAFGGCASTPVTAVAPAITGSNAIGIITFSAPIAAGTVLVLTYGDSGYPSTSALVVSFTLQKVDIVSEGYSLPSSPQIVDSTDKFFSVLFGDEVSSKTSTWAYQVTEIVA